MQRSNTKPGIQIYRFVDVGMDYKRWKKGIAYIVYDSIIEKLIWLWINTY